MIGQTLLNYRILEKLGAGGQGEVYKAVDTTLGRTVVVKVLAPELTAHESTLKRFEREAQLASALDHQNICIIYGLHEVDGLHFITMQHIEGRNVRQLVNGKPLALRTSVSIALQVADALAAAHARGIIHRDIKAGNVMVTPAGTVKVLDFGLAKLVDDADADKHDLHLTALGEPYGTATYAAPEQATGGRVDHRADIFSTGVLLYEMLAGRWPFRGKTSVEVRYAVLHEAARPVKAFRSDVPPRLQQILDRALAKDPKDRFQKIAEFRDELRGVLREIELNNSVSVSSDSMATAPPRHLSGSRGVAHTLRRWVRGIARTEARSETRTSASQSSTPGAQEAQQTSISESTKKSLAILPFRNLNNDSTTSFYEFSLADAVVTELARLRKLIVRPSSLIAKYQGQQKDPLEIGRELGVDAILSSSYLSVGERLRVNAQLLDVAGGGILWSHRIDAEASDIIALQDKIVQHIVEGLRLELSADEQVAIERRPTADGAAYKEYLHGRDRLVRYMYHTPAHQDFEAAVEHFQRAIQLDPSFALAHAGLGVCHTTRVFDKIGDAEDYELAEQAFSKALKIDPGLVEARLHMVFIYLTRGEKQTARTEIERLLREAPNDAAVHRVAGNLYRLNGEHDKALSHFDRAAALNPDERVNAYYNRARVFNSLGEKDAALRELDKASAIEPDHPLIKAIRAFMLYYRGETAAAAALVGEVLASHPEMDSVRPLLAMCLSRQGEHEAARAALTERVKASAAVDPDIAYWLASAFALDGEREQALEWLARAINLGREDRAWFEMDPDWESLRDDPRFKQLMNGIEAGRKEDNP